MHALDILKFDFLLESVVCFDGERSWLFEYAEAVAVRVVDGFLVTGCDAEMGDEYGAVKEQRENRVLRFLWHGVEPCGAQVAVF